MRKLTEMLRLHFEAGRCAVKGGASLQVQVLPRQLAVQPRSYGWTASG